tara:strand:- start:83 stop:502 length:420 start_codon:yes stop_codon:yes gene_type:complete
MNIMKEQTLHIYTRVSTSIQEVEGTSLDNQKNLRIKKSHELGLEKKVWNEVGSLIATIMVGYDGHRGSINYLAVDRQFSGHGFGRMLVQAAEEFLRGIGCAKINLGVRRENEAVIQFDDKLGYAEATVYYCGRRLIEDQ